MASGSWTLKECHIDGDFIFNTVVELLPVTLEKLVLHLSPTKHATRKHKMSCFSRLSNLTYLSIDFGVPFDSLDCSGMDHLFVFNCRLPRLRSLYMCTTPVVLSAEHGFPGTELHSLLPCIEHMALHVIWHVAPAVIMLHSLRCLKMKMHAPLASQTGYPCYLTIPSGCSLSRLTVIGPEEHNVRICVAVWKQELDLNCVNVSDVALCHESVLHTDCPFDIAMSGF